MSAMDRFDLSSSIAAAMAIVRQVDAFINDTAPFKLAKDPENQTIVDAILYRCAEAIRIAACLLEAVMPDHVDELRRAWHLDVNDESLEASCVWGRLQPGTAIDKIALFPRIEVEDTSDA